MKTAVISFGGNPTKETVIELLSREWPLTAKKIYRRLVKGYNISITYQAVHKSLTELTEKKILEKRAKKNLMTLREQVEDIIRQSAIRTKAGINDPFVKVDDRLVEIFSRRKKGKKK